MTAALPLAIVVSVVSMAATAAAQSFTTQAFASGPGPLYAEGGDVNGDGLLDMMTSSPFPGNFSVLLATAPGSFLPPLTTMEPTLFVTLADVSGDGVLDLITAHPQGVIGVRLGNGSGGFAPATNVGGTVSIAALAGDLNQDGICDIAGAGYYDVSLLFGFGGGAFAPPASTALGFLALHPQLGDLDLDGQLDIVFSSQQQLPPFGFMISYGVTSMLALGGGAFAPPVTVPLTTVASEQAMGTGPMRLCDLNTDGFLDATISVPTGLGAAQKIITLVGGPGGALVPFPTSTGAVGVNSFEVGDADGDGNADAHFTEPGSGLWIARGTGNGTFNAATLYPMGTVPSGLFLGDADADGRLDAVTTHYGAVFVTLHTNASPPFAGVVNYGAGTAGCLGVVGLDVTAAPMVNSPAFGFVSSNAPSNALGLLLVSDQQDLAGSDPVGIGATLHVGLFGGTLLGLDAGTDASGAGFAPAPIPNNPFLHGQQFFGQAIFVESAAHGRSCGPSPFGIVTSKGIALSIP